MNQLQLIAIANVIPRDATSISTDMDDDEVRYYSVVGEPRVVGYSEMGRPMIEVTITHERGQNWSSWFRATAKEVKRDT